MKTSSLVDERPHLANLLEAVQRCTYFLYEKLDVIDSIDSWQLCRTARNLAAHDCETNYALIAEHFNELQTLQPILVKAASRLVALCAQTLGIMPATSDFESEFQRVCAAIGA